MARRLPIYLLVDCSESMAGPGLEQVQQGVDTVLRGLRTNPHALETAYLSLITFAGEARVEIPLTEIGSIKSPQLAVRAGTALGGALRLLQRRFQEELIPTTRERKGDWRPLVFLLTDGQPTDDWEAAAAALHGGGATRPANVYAIGCGPDVDYAALKRVADVVLRFPDVSPTAMQKLFLWLTASIQSASVSPDAATSKVPAGLETLPAGTLVGDDVPAHSSRPRQVFLRGLCSGDARPYLMRFVWDPAREVYLANASHALQESFIAAGASQLPPVDSSSLLGCAPCPHCGKPLAALCGNCNVLFCTDERTEAPVVCPGCRTTLTGRNEGGGFAIPQSVG